MAGNVYLIPSVLYDGRTECIPVYVLDAIKQCESFFVENERTARRYFKILWKEMVIDNYGWYNIKEPDEETLNKFRQLIKDGKTVGIVSEAGCPGVADPGQRLVEIAHQHNVTIKPLVGPSSILLALMASGMNGQQFQFHGYLPIQQAERSKSIKMLENESRQKQLTQIFIETPYRNQQLLETILKSCQPSTKLCVAADLTAESEWIKTKTVKEWKSMKTDLHKKPVIFLLQA